MTFTAITCVIASCDTCGSKFNEDSGSEWAGIAHFESEAEALTEVADVEGWVVTGTAIKCGRCIDKAECALAGHDFRPYFEDKTDADGWRDFIVSNKIHEYVGRVRHCRRCSGIEFDPPHEHPLAISVQTDGEPQHDERGEDQEPG